MFKKNFDQKFFQLKIFFHQKFPSTKKFFWPYIFFTKKFSIEDFFNQKFIKTKKFGPKDFLPRNFLNPKFFGLKIFSNTIFFSDPKTSDSKNVFRTKRLFCIWKSFWRLRFLGAEFFWGNQIFFGPKIFSYPSQMNKELTVLPSTWKKTILIIEYKSKAGVWHWRPSLVIVYFWPKTNNT